MLLDPATHAELTDWRKHLHMHPELGYEVHRTAQFVADKLHAFGVDEVVTGIGRTGVVGIVRGNRASARVFGLRADMDALEILEEGTHAHISRHAGHMHACGHDGHVTMLLGAARELARDRDFYGTAVLIFQPAEEGGGGGLAMMEDGLAERFGITEFFALHTMPGVPLGHFATCPGPFCASADQFEVRLAGRGGHAARPHTTIDPLIAACHTVAALQTIMARNVPALSAAVLSVAAIEAGKAFNVIPQSATFRGTVRALDSAQRDLIEARFKEIVHGQASSFGCEADISYQRGYPVCINDAAATDFAVKVAQSVAGRDRVYGNTEPSLAADDFAYLLAARPGAYLLIGNGDSALVHQSTYDFDDRATPYGVEYFVALMKADRGSD